MGVLAQRQAFTAIRLGDITKGVSRYGQEVLEGAMRPSHGGQGDEEDPAGETEESPFSREKVVPETK